jgi:hypothetical protein
MSVNSRGKGETSVTLHLVVAHFVLLIAELGRLYKEHPQVREYYDQLISPNEKQLLKRYKKTVRDEFFPDKGDGQLRYSVVTNAIRQFRKLPVSDEAIADLLLYYAENGVEFTMEYGDIDERFYDTMECKYHDALEFIKEKSFLPTFKERAQRCRDETEGVGWGFHDTLCDMFYEFYGEG